MSLPKYRFVDDLDDGVAAYQCLNCYKEVAIRSSIESWVFCPYCGIKWEGELEFDTKKLNDRALRKCIPIPHKYVELEWRSGDDLDRWSPIFSIPGPFHKIDEIRNTFQEIRNTFQDDHLAIAVRNMKTTVGMMFDRADLFKEIAFGDDAFEFRIKIVRGFSGVYVPEDKLPKPFYIDLGKVEVRNGTAIVYKPSPNAMPHL